jgi:dTDP-4-dehydrorhamnose 3,5-epimerase
MIENVAIKELKIFKDNRGSVMHMAKRGDDAFKNLSEVYFSLINAGIVKGWKKHKKMTQHFAVPYGNIKIVLYDDREDSASKGEIQEIHIGQNHYALVKIPPMVWYSFKCIDGNCALVANCADMIHDPNEVIVADIKCKDIPYDWIP